MRNDSVDDEMLEVFWQLWGEGIRQRQTHNIIILLKYDKMMHNKLAAACLRLLAGMGLSPGNSVLLACPKQYSLIGLISGVWARWCLAKASQRP